MQTANVILAILNQKSKKNANYQFDRLYRHLFNQDFYLQAYGNIHAKEGNMTPGFDGKTIDGFSKEKVDVLISFLQGETYYPLPVKRKYIEKKNSTKLRPLGIPTFSDKLIQEVLRMLLEAIYEPVFLDCSHGFRPNRSCHTALHEIKNYGKGTNWVIEGDIKGFFDNIDHEILLSLISRRIKDGRIIELLRRFLKAGYFEFDKVHGSLSGTPQGGIISPILANIYLHELDQLMDKLSKKLSSPKSVKRKRNPEYQRLFHRRRRAIKKGDHVLAKDLLKKMRKMPSIDPYDKDYKKIKYTRYADDFVVFIQGDKEFAKDIKDNIKEFLDKELKLELSEEKTLLTNFSERRVRFLGYELAKTTDDNALSVNPKTGKKSRLASGSVRLLVPNDVISTKIKPFTKDGKPVHNSARLNQPVLDTIYQYNAEIRGLYNYYSLAVDVGKKIGRFKYYHYYSLAKTISAKEKCSVKEVFSKYGKPVKRRKGSGTKLLLSVEYDTKKGRKTLSYFNDPLAIKDLPVPEVSEQIFTYYRRSQIIDRLNANKCELCQYKSDNPYDFEVHHIRKLKDVKKKYSKRGKTIPNWVLHMSAMNRKTLVVCKGCHGDIHAGRLQKSLKKA